MKTRMTLFLPHIFLRRMYNVSVAHVFMNSFLAQYTRTEASTVGSCGEVHIDYTALRG